MIAPPVATEAQLQKSLKSLGYAATPVKTATGTFWQHSATKRHLLVPFSKDGFYPDWLINEISIHARNIGDQATADGLSTVAGWSRLAATKAKAKTGKRP